MKPHSNEKAILNVRVCITLENANIFSSRIFLKCCNLNLFA